MGCGPRQVTYEDYQMKQWLKEFIHNVIVHPLMMFMPSKYGNWLHDWNATWTFNLGRYDELQLEGKG